MEYQDDRLVVKRIPKDTNLDPTTTIYELDNGHSPYPYEERLRLGFWPFDVTYYASDRNVLSITEVDPDTLDEEIVKTFTYEYNEYGYPVRMEMSDSDGVVRYFEYSEQP